MAIRNSYVELVVKGQIGKGGCGPDIAVRLPGAVAKREK